jgi:hypothetical protein
VLPELMQTGPKKKKKKKGSTIRHMAAVHPGALATGSPTEKKKNPSFLPRPF